MTLQERINQADEARRLTADDSILSRIFDALSREYAEEWRNTQRDQRDRREELYQKLHVLTDVRDTFRRLILDGKMAEREAEFIEREERINA